MLASGKEQRDVLPLCHRYNPAGKHSGALRRSIFRMDILMARIPAQRQHGHGRVVVVQYFALRRVANQLHHRRLDRGGRFRYDLALRRGRQQEYLVLATVLETCEFNNLNVLKFLLSKETTLEGLLRMAGRKARDLKSSVTPHC